MIESLQDGYRLNNGICVPAVGLGCYKAVANDVYRAVSWAIEAGYRHIDTAMFYRNEKDIGRALKEHASLRDQLFVVSKIWPSRFDRPEESIESSLRDLGVDYLDGYLLHWPGVRANARCKTWEALLRYEEKGLIRCPGVSNFEIPHLEELISEFGAAPTTNQIQLHPWYQQRELSSYCRDHGIQVVAWGPILRGRLKEEPLAAELAKKYGRSPAQIVLRWHLQNGNVVIPKSVNHDRIIENSRLFDFSLDEQDMSRISSLDCGRILGGNDPFTFDGGEF